MLATARRLDDDRLRQITAVLEILEGSNSIESLVRIDVEIEDKDAGFGSGSHADHGARPFSPPLFDDRTIERCIFESVSSERLLVFRIAGESVASALIPAMLM